MNHSRLVVISIAITLTLLSLDSAIAGPYSDDLSKCFVKSTSDDDKNTLVKWVFAISSLHPAIHPLASISDLQREEINKKTAEVFVNLLTNSCKSETQLAAKYEGSDALKTGFQVLGQIAIRGVFADPNVAKGLTGFGKYIDKDKLKEISGIEKESKWCMSVRFGSKADMGKTWRIGEFQPAFYSGVSKKSRTTAI